MRLSFMSVRLCQLLEPEFELLPLPVPLLALPPPKPPRMPPRPVWPSMMDWGELMMPLSFCPMTVTVSPGLEVADLALRSHRDRHSDHGDKNDIEPIVFFRRNLIAYPGFGFRTGTSPRGIVSCHDSVIRLNNE